MTQKRYTFRNDCVPFVFWPCLKEASMCLKDTLHLSSKIIQYDRQDRMKLFVLLRGSELMLVMMFIIFYMIKQTALGRTRRTVVCFFSFLQQEANRLLLV